MKKILGLISSLLLALFLSDSFAVTGSVAPTTVTYVAGSNASIVLTWSFTTANNGGGTISSPNGVFSTDNTTLTGGATNTPATPISNSGSALSVNTTLNNDPSSITEVVTIPASVMNFAMNNNLNTIYYSRNFFASIESSYTNTRFIQINLTYPVPTLTVSPGTINYVPGSNALLSLLWNITTYGDGNNRSLPSSAGVFSATSYIGQTSLGTLNTTLNTPALPDTGTVSTIENLLIPQTVLDAAQATGLTSIYFIRSFFDNPCAPTASCPYGTNASSVRINLVAPNPNAALALSRVALRFSDNTSVKVIQPNTSLMALADISYTGSGLLNAMWEIAEPVSTLGQPVFVPIQPVRQFLVAGGRVYLQTPPLPTQQQGLHVVRLTINQPIPGFTLPILQYAVNPDGDVAGALVLPPVRINSPPDNALLARDTQFNWQAVKGARAYQLELFLPEQSGLKPDDAAITKHTPATGVMVPAKKNTLSLGELSRNKLRPNTTYYWRILAIGDGGQILSASALREIRIP